MALKLVLPDESHEEAWKDILAEFKAHGEKPSYGLHMKVSIDEYSLYLKKDHDYRQGINLPEGFPPKTVYFLMEDSSDEIWGHVTIRHFLNDYLKDVGGHIGYDIRPSRRGYGYGTKQLTMALNICRQMGMDEVMIACNSDNSTSAAVIRNNGGKFESVFIEADGTIVERYWISLK